MPPQGAPLSGFRCTQGRLSPIPARQRLPGRSKGAGAVPVPVFPVFPGLPAQHKAHHPFYKPARAPSRHNLHAVTLRALNLLR